jgi:phosphinothricin acetyltransferase
MSNHKVHRAAERDVGVLGRFCAEAAASPSGLLGHRRERLAPATWVAGRVPLVVAEDPTGAVGFAVALSEHAPLAAARCAEGLVYVSPAHRRRGAGRALFAELVAVARAAGLWKLFAYALPEDVASRALLTRLDFREVGTLVKHLQLGGSWRDVALHERLVLAARKSTPSYGEVKAIRE